MRLLRFDDRNLCALVIIVCSMRCRHAVECCNVAIESSSFPLNAAAVVGETVTFNCRTNTTHSIDWKHAYGIKDYENFLFKDGNFTEYCENCSLNRTERGQYDLVISSVKLTDAGKYKCVKSERTNIKSESSAESKTYSAELIVIDSPPKCDTNLTKANGSKRGDVKSGMLWCVVEFRGRFGPVMRWKNERTGKVIPSTINTSINAKVESEVVVRVDDDDVISCVTFFNQSTSGEDKNTHDTPAENIPAYNFTWTHKVSNESATTSSQKTDENSSFSSHIVSVFVPVLLLFFFIVLLLLICLTFRKSQRGCFRKATVVADDVGLGVSYEVTERIYYEDPTDLLHPEEYSNDDLDNRIRLQNSAHRPNASTLYPDITTGERSVENASNGVENRQRNRRRIPNEIEAAPVSSTERRTRGSHVTIGSDGTVYAEVDRDHHVTSMVRNRQPMESLEKSVYAAIDHTVTTTTQDLTPPRPPRVRF